MPRLLARLSLVAAFLALAAGGARSLAQGPQNIIVNQIDDVALGTWSGLGNMSQIMNFCVGRQGGAHQFRLTAIGPGSGGAFTLTNGISQLPFSLEVKDNSGVWYPLTANMAVSLLTGTNHNRCINLNAEGTQLRVTLQQTNLAAASGGTYSGAVRLTVVPE